MLQKGSCSCNQWQVEANFTQTLGQLNPRICDCDYCRSNPSSIVSDPTMVAAFTGSEITTTQNGDRLARFYYCASCAELLAVGCDFNGQMRGAINLNLLQNAHQFGEVVQIQPRLLSADEKLERWERLWGVLRGLQ